MGDFILTFLMTMIATSVAIYFFGAVISRIVQSKKAQGSHVVSFYYPIIGWVSSGIVIAVVATGGDTFLSIAAVVFVLGYIYTQKPKFASRLVWPVIVAGTFRFVGLSVIIFAVNWLILHDFSWNVYVYSSNDFAYYARLSDFLLSTGSESASLDYINPNSHAKIPYHYVEHWYTGAISRLFNITTTQSYPLIVIPQLLSILLLGLYELFRSGNKNSLMSWVLATAALTVSGFAVLYPSFIPALHVYIHDWSIIAFVKILPYYMIALAAIFQIQHKNFLFAALLTFLGGMIYTTMLPAATVFSTLIIIYGVFYNRNDSRKYLVLFGIFLVSLVIFAVRYFLQEDGMSNPALASAGKFDIVGHAQVGVNILIKLGVAIFIVLLPYTVSFVLLWKRSGMRIKEFVYEESPFVLLFFGAIFALIPYALMHHIPNAHQLYRSLYFVCGNLAGIYIIKRLIDYGGFDLKVWATFLLVVNISLHTYYIPDHESKTITHKKIQSISQQIPNFNGKVAYFRWKPANTSYYLTETMVFSPGKMLSLIKSPHEIYCLNPEVIKQEGARDFRQSQEDHIYISPISQFARKFPDTADRGEIIRQFLDANLIEVILVPRGFTLPNGLDQLLTEGIALDEEYTLFYRNTFQKK